MPNPIVISGALALTLGGIVFALLAGQSRAEKRRAAVVSTARRTKESSDQAE